MPLITPPRDDDYPSFTKEEEQPEKVELSDWENHRRITLFLNVRPWLCPRCGITNFGRNQYCANFKCKIPRPKDHKLHGT